MKTGRIARVGIAVGAVALVSLLLAGWLRRPAPAGASPERSLRPEVGTAAPATLPAAAVAHTAAQTGKTADASAPLPKPAPIARDVSARSSRDVVEEGWRADMAEALAMLEAESEMMREDLLLTLLDAIAWTDVEEILEYLRNAGGDSEVARDLATRLVRLWAQHDAAGAAGWVSRMAPGAARQAAVDQVAVVWVEQDMPRAIAWAKDLPADMEHDQAVRQVAYEVARTKPVAALELAVELPSSPKGDELIRYAALQWAARDPQAAAEWASRIDNASLREGVLANVATAWAEQDPAAAADLALEEMSPGRRQDNAIVAIVQRSVQQDPPLTAEWVCAFPETPMKEAAMDNLVSIWSNQDALSLDAWLAGLNGQFEF